MKDVRELEFAIFVIEGVAERLGIAGDEAYRMLKDGPDVLDTYVIPSYDVLHTQGRSYVIDDVLRAMHKLGALA